MIEIGLTEILTLSAAIMGPLITVITILWNDRVKKEDAAALTRKEERIAYDSMRDRMQEKIDAANRQASEAIVTATAAINSMKDLLVSVQEAQRKQGEQWPIFKDELLQAVKNGLNCKVSP